MKSRLAMLALPLALAACGDNGDFHMPWDKPEPAPAAAPATPATPPKPTIPEPTGAPPTVEALQVAGETKKIATADSETLAVTDFAAKGEGWSASVNGGSARFERPGAKAATVSVKRIPYSGGVEYIGTLGDQPFVLRVNANDCNGEPLTASLRANGKNYSGCASPAGAKTAAAAPGNKPEA